MLESAAVAKTLLGVPLSARILFERNLDGPMQE